MYLPYPNERPPGDVNLGPTWFQKDYYAQWARRLFPLHVQSPRPFHMIEIGSYLGRSALGWLDIFPLAQLTCIDIWFDFPKHQDNLVYLKECVSGDPKHQFFVNTWDARSRIRVVNAPSYEGMEWIYHNGKDMDIEGDVLTREHGPDIIYHDGNHTALVVERDVTFAHKLWPHVRQFGDDWETFPAVLVGAQKAASLIGGVVEVCGPFWNLRM